jgi:hypothetical protein
VEVNGVRTSLRLNRADAARLGVGKPAGTPGPGQPEQTPPDTPGGKPAGTPGGKKNVTSAANKARTGDDVENK